MDFWAGFPWGFWCRIEAWLCRRIFGVCWHPFQLRQVDSSINEIHAIWLLDSHKFWNFGSFFYYYVYPLQWVGLISKCFARIYVYFLFIDCENHMDSSYGKWVIFRVFNWMETYSCKILNLEWMMILWLNGSVWPEGDVWNSVGKMEMKGGEMVSEI